MEYIHSKDIFLLMRDTLKLIDRRPMDHGSRVAYYLYKMLECRGGYEKFELADFVYLASLHDIGAYRTDNLNDLIHYDGKEPIPHATYGYLVFKYLSPLSDLAGVILYHHTNYSSLRQLNFEYKEIAACLNLAEKVDIYSRALGDKFTLDMFEKHLDTVISREAFGLLKEAEELYGVTDRIREGTYKEELHDIVSYMIYNNEEKRKFLEMLMYCQGFKSEKSVVDTVTCLCITESLGQKAGLDELQKEELYYGTLLHDIGMLAMPKEILDAARELTREERQKVKTHVYLVERVLKDRMAEEVVDIVAAHHERCDGSGYPRGLRDVQMNQPQKILQLSDVVTALMGARQYRPAFEQSKIEAYIRKEAAAGKYNKAIVNILLDNYDEIMQRIRIRSEEIMVTYRKLNQHYMQVSKKIRA